MAEEETKTKEEKPGNLPEEVTKVLEDIKAKLEEKPTPEEKRPEPSLPSYADRRAALQKSLKFDDDQMAAHEQIILQSQAPIIENLGWSKLEKRADLDTYRKEIEAELSVYPQERRTPDIMEKIYYFVKGKHADSKPKEEPRKGPVVQTRVSSGPGYTGSNPGMSGDRDEAGSKAEDEALDDREKFVASKLGITDKDYAKSRNAGREIRSLRIPDERQSSSMADIELRRLQGRR